MPGQDSNSVKGRIVARILEVLQPLLAEGKFRMIRRAQSVTLAEPITPAIHVVIGDDVPDDEDSRGYLTTFAVAFKLLVKDARDPFALADDSEAFIQEKLEADPQLVTGGSALCRRVIWKGSSPFTTDLGVPDGGTLVDYSIQYGRERGNPAQNY